VLGCTPRTMRIATVGSDAILVAVALMLACGGTSTREGSASTGGSSAGGAGAGVGDNDNHGGATVVPELCSLPSDSGTCEAYFPRFYYNADADRCEEFVYGGCDGNENNFETLAECEATCRPGESPAEMDSCREPSDCVVVGASCCGPCEPVTIDGLAAINVGFLSAYTESLCGDAVCDGCPPPIPSTATRQNFGTTCESGRCVVFDVREHELSACTDDADCMLRTNMDCCEGCTTVAPTAVNASADIVAVVCGDAPVSCVTCAPVLPANAVAICESTGHCGVAYTGP